MAAFAHKVPSLRASIILLLKKCLSDSDDEVRERAHFYVKIFEIQESNDTEVSKEDQQECEDIKTFLFDEEQTIDVFALEQFVVANKEQLIASDNFEIDISPMVLSGDRNKKQAKKSDPVAQTNQASATKAPSGQKQEAQSPTVVGEDAFDIALKDVEAV